MEEKTKSKTSIKQTKSEARGLQNKAQPRKKVVAKKASDNAMLDKIEKSKIDNILHGEKIEGVEKMSSGKQKHNKEVVKESGISAKSIELFINNNTDRSICDIIFCNLIAMSAMLLAAFVPLFSLALPILVFFYFEVGVSGYLLKKENGDSCRFEEIFISLKKYIKIFCLGVVKFFSIAFGLLLLVVPGVLAMLNFAFTPFILAEDSELDVKGVLMLSKELVYGFRLKIFFFLLLSLLAVAAAASLMFLIVLLFDAFLVVPYYVYFISIIAAAVLAVVLLALPMIQIVLTDYYILSKQIKVR